LGHPLSTGSRDASVGRVSAAAAAVVFGTAPVATSFQLRSFEPVPAAMWRAIVGASALIVVAWLRGSRSRRRSLPTRGAFARLGLLGVLGGPVFLFGLNVAVSETGASISGIVVGSYAVFAAVVAPFLLGEPLEARAITGLVVALIGTVLLASLTVTGTSLLGIGAGLFGAVGYAFYLVLGRKWMDANSLAPQTVALAAALTTALVFLPWLSLTAPATIVPDAARADSLIALGWLAAVMVTGQTLVMMSARRIDSRRSASFLLLNPLTAAVLGVLVLGEMLTAQQVGGGGLVLIGIALGSGLSGFRR